MSYKIENLYYATCRVSANILKEYYEKNNITIEPIPEYYEYQTIVYKNDNNEYRNVYSDNAWDRYLETLNIHDNNYPRYNRKCFDISNVFKKISLEDNIDYIVEKYSVLEIKRKIKPNSYADERMFSYWIDDYIKFIKNTKENVQEDNVAEIEENEETEKIDSQKRKYITLNRGNNTAIF